MRLEVQLKWDAFGNTNQCTSLQNSNYFWATLKVSAQHKRNKNCINFQQKVRLLFCTYKGFSCFMVTTQQQLHCEFTRPKQQKTMPHIKTQHFCRNLWGGSNLKRQKLGRSESFCRMKWKFHLFILYTCCVDSFWRKKFLQAFLELSIP